MRSNMYNSLQPIKRSKLRLKLGKIYYTYARYLLWLSPRLKFAKQYSDTKLQYPCFTHKTLLLR
ncbi:MAG: vancomycin resistance protein, partial [Candidatus Cellulosilyticum pullistercoris]|nr:vancomycin resistance protein [Candidatus Cellulosilyticum pullistercoris]